MTKKAKLEAIAAALDADTARLHHPPELGNIPIRHKE